MFDLEGTTRQVLANCAVSDAQSAGGFSICGLALRLRDLFKWEQGLDPWEEGESGEVLDWIGRREEAWEGVAGDAFRPLQIDGREYEPFDVDGVNAVLEPRGLYYGAGFVRALVPIFFLALVESRRPMNGGIVTILGRELARGLLTVPALTQGRTILVRRETARRFIWDRIFYAEGGGEGALRFALRQYGLEAGRPDEVPPHLDRIVAGELDLFIRHELGELSDTVFDREIWRGILSAYPHSAVALLARAVKDLLADTGDAGTLRYVIEGRRRSSLGFYVSMLDGLRKALFPEMSGAFSAFRETGNWEAVETARRQARDRAVENAGILTEAFLRGRDENALERAEAEIEERILVPMGIQRMPDEGAR